MVMSANAAGETAAAIQPAKRAFLISSKAPNVELRTAFSLGEILKNSLGLGGLPNTRRTQLFLGPILLNPKRGSRVPSGLLRILQMIPQVPGKQSRFRT